MRILVNGALHRTEHARRGLPLVEEQRLFVGAERGVRVSQECGGLRGSVEAHDLGSVSARRRRLARRARPEQQQGRKLAEKLGYLPVEETL